MKVFLCSLCAILVISFTLIACKSAPETAPEEITPPAQPVVPPEQPPITPPQPEEPVSDIDWNSLFADINAEIETVRSGLIADSVKSILSKQFAQVESLRNTYLGLQNAGEKNDDVLHKGKIVLMQYETLAYALESAALVREIDAFALAAYSKAEYDEALNKLVEADDLFFTDGGSEASYKKAEEAMFLLSTVVSKGFQSAAKNEQTKVEKIKKDSDEQKAMNAVKQGYADALAVYNAGIKAVQGQKYKEAYTLFVQAEGAFNKVYAEAVEKREKALQALANAQKGIEEADEKAKKADETAPLADTDVDSLPEMRAIEENGGAQ